jgi:hypothetical protein
MPVRSRCFGAFNALRCTAYARLPHRLRGRKDIFTDRWRTATQSRFTIVIFRTTLARICGTCAFFYPRCGAGERHRATFVAPRR